MAKKGPHAERVLTGAKPCGAKNRRGQPCQQPSMPNGRCRFHGGKSLSGPASPSFKHGRYSKVLPARLLETYQTAREDPELLSLKEECAVVQSRIVQLAGKLETADNAQLWQELREAWQAFDQADGSQQQAARERIAGLIVRGASEADQWDALNAAIQDKAKIARIEWRRMIDLDQVMTAAQVTTLCMALLDSVLRHVPEPAKRQAIATEFNFLLTAGRQTDEAV